MKKDYNAPEFLKIYMVEDVLDISGNDNLGDDKADDNYDKPDETGLASILAD